MKISNMKTVVIGAVLLSFYFQINAQNERYFVGQDSTLYWNKKLPVYIQLSPTPDGKGINLESKEYSEYSNPVFFDTEGPNFIRTKEAVNNKTMKIVPRLEVLFKVVADGQSPSTSADLKGAPAYNKDGHNYYGKGLEFELSADDKYSGVEKVYWSLNDTFTKEYTDPVVVNLEGDQMLYYFAEDRVGNMETKNTKQFIVDLTPPEITHNINGVAENNTVASSTTIYFTGVDKISGLKNIYYRFDDGSFTIYRGINLSLQSLEDGNHTLEYYAEDFVGNKSSVIKYDFYYDKLAPITASDILGDKYIWQDKVYFSGRTKMKLTAIDNKSGVKDILYAIDGEPFKVYTDPFYLPNLQGDHIIKFYSNDRVSNAPSGAEEYKHNVNRVFLDLTGPDISNQWQGPFYKTLHELFIGPKTSILIDAKDQQSGVQKIAYSVDRNQEETTYEKPFSVNLTSGKHTIELFAYDNVNNRNTVANEILFDGDLPKIFTNFSVATIGQKEGINMFPPHTTLYLAATDESSGNEKIFFTMNGASEKLYTSPLTNFVNNTKYELKIRAIDNVGNEKIESVTFYIGDK